MSEPDAPADEDEQSAINGPVASRLGQVSWGLFDWANQPYFALVTTFLFAPYFAAGFVGDPVRGQELWGYTQATAGLLIALGSPILGSIADASGRRKPWIFGFSIPFVIATALLWTAVPGAPDGVLFVMAAAVVAAAAMEFSVVFNNAMLPSLVPTSRLGRLSGFGWGIGYVGGLVALLLLLGFLAGDRETGLTLIGLEPLFGLDPAMNEADRATGPISAVWYIVFVLPLFLFTPDQKATGLRPLEAARSGLRTFGRTLGHLRSYRMIALFLLSRMLYTDGLSAIFAFGGIYASGIFGWEIQTLGIFGIVLMMFAAIGAFVGGRLDDTIGSKRTLQIAVGMLLIGVFLSASVTRDTVLYVIPVEPPAEGAGAFSSLGEQLYLLFGIVIGLAGGPTQAASRSMLARMAPPTMMTEFFGLYAFSGKATAFAAPFLLGVVTAAYASQRAGLIVIVAFLLAGFVLLFAVREGRVRETV